MHPSKFVYFPRHDTLLKDYRKVDVYCVRILKVASPTEVGIIKKLLGVRLIIFRNAWDVYEGRENGKNIFYDETNTVKNDFYCN